MILGIDPEELIPAAGGGPIGLLFFGAGIVAQLLGGLFGLFNGSGGPTNADLSKLRDDTNKAIDTATRFAWKVAFGVGAIMQALDWMWKNVVKKLAATVLDLVKRLGDLITKVLVPVVKAMQKFRDLMNKVYDKFLRPVLKYISLVRRYLQILKALHIPFADKLDGILARIQGKIIAPYLWVLRTVNGYGRWINLIITAHGIIQRPIFTNTHYKYQSTTVQMFWNSQTSKMRPSGESLTVPPPTPPTTEEATQSFADFAKSDGGDYAPIAQTTEELFREGLAL